MNQQETMTLALQVARSLGSGYNAEPFGSGRYDSWALITTPKKRQFFLKADNGRVFIDGRYQRPNHPDGNLWQFKPYNSKAPEITVSATKPAAAIAKDIQRRFLPAFDELYEHMLEAKQRQEDYETTSCDNALRLMRASGEVLKLSQNNRKHLSFYAKDAGYGDVDVSGDSVTIKLHSMKVEFAEKLLRVLAEIREK